jgi:hypothetical protein
MFRRRQPTDNQPPLPEWQRRFDAATELVLSRPQPVRVHDRVDELRRSLIAAQERSERLGATIEQLDPDSTAAELKSVLRERERRLGDGDDLDRRVATLRRRYEAVHDMINRQETIDRRMLDICADVELLAVQALRAETIGADPGDQLDEHLERLGTDLHALELARREVDAIAHPIITDQSPENHSR